LLVYLTATRVYELLSFIARFLWSATW
jgi:hypothetical protein